MGKSYSRILVAVDGSKQAELALEKAVAITKRNEAYLSIIHVIEQPSASYKRDLKGALGDQLEAKGQKLLEKSLAYAHANGLDEVDSWQEFGSPRYIIAEKTVDEKNIDLIIIGATGVGAIGRFLIGSVADGVTRNAHCDVLVVRTNTE